VVITKRVVGRTSRISAILLLIPIITLLGIAPSHAAQLNPPRFPTATSDSATSIKVNFSLSDNGTASSYTVFLYTSESDPSPLEITNYTRNTAITGLTTEATYLAKVRAIGGRVNGRGNVNNSSSELSAFSNSVTVGATAGLPTITVQPTNQSSTFASTATFSVTATSPDSGTLGYQWQVSTNSGGSWSNVSSGTGGTTSSYTTSTLAMAANAYRYLVNVTNSKNGATSETVTSSAVILTVAKANQAALTSPVLSATTATDNGGIYSQALTLTSVGGGSSTGAVSITGVVDGTATGCSFSAGTLTRSTAGTCTLTITKAGDANYNAVSTTATFTFRARSTENNLGSLTITPGTTSPVFSSATTNYSVSVSSAVTDLSVTATLASEFATMTLNGLTLLPNTAATVAVDTTTTSQVITIRVTAEDLTIKDFVISVRRVVTGTTSTLLLPNATPTPSASPIKSTRQMIQTPTVSVLPRISSVVNALGETITSAPALTSVTINGSGFNSLLSVKLNGVKITPSSTSVSAITLTIPAAARSGTIVVTTTKGSVSTPRLTITTSP